jgi:hypothetical protein
VSFVVIDQTLAYATPLSAISRQPSTVLMAVELAVPRGDICATSPIAGG